jgi:hypothetical protein
VLREDGRVRRPLIVGVFVVVVVVGALTAIMLVRSTNDYDCKGVGLSATSASTPELAFRSYLAGVGGDRSQWRAGGYGAHFYRRSSDAAVPDFKAIIVDERTPGVWSVSGACV